MSSLQPSVAIINYRIRDIDFYKGGFSHLLGVGYASCITKQNQTRLTNGLPPLNQETAEALWNLLTDWYFLRWCPANAKMKQMKALTKIKLQTQVSTMKTYWVEGPVSQYNIDTLKSYWEGEMFKDVLEFLDEQSAEYTEKFTVDLVPVYTPWPTQSMSMTVRTRGPTTPVNTNPGTQPAANLGGLLSETQLPADQPAEAESTELQVAATSAETPAAIPLDDRYVKAMVIRRKRGRGEDEDKNRDERKEHKKVKVEGLLSN